MRAALLLAAFAVVVAAPTAAQPCRSAAPQWVELDCTPRSHAALRAELADLPELTADGPDRPNRFCLTPVSLPAGAPFRRLAVFQLVGSYWCGTAGCSTFIYGQDVRGRWTDISPQDTMTNAQAERVRVDRARAFRGMPRLAIVTGGGGARPGTAEWGWIPRLGRYSD